MKFDSIDTTKPLRVLVAGESMPRLAYRDVDESSGVVWGVNKYGPDEYVILPKDCSEGHTPTPLLGGGWHPKCAVCGMNPLVM